MPFRPEEWARIKEVFDQARPLPPAGRRAFLAASCASEPTVHGHVERLLAADQLASGFLDGSAVAGADPEDAAALDCPVIGDYAVTALIGTGGMGEVYKAHDAKLDRPVALKLLPARLTRDPEWLRRFRAEARAASSLNHPHILVVHDFGELDGRPYIVMELVEGQTLRERIQAGPMSVREALGITAQVASALAAAHARGIVHRDIKPENLMLRPDGYVKVLDFGLARQLAGQETGAFAATEAGVVVGTLRYMSPEQTRAEAAQPSSDVFSLGLVLFEMVTGRHPFHAESTIGVLQGIQASTAEPSGGGPELDELLADMLRKAPATRPSAHDIVTRIAAFTTRPPGVEFVARRRLSVGREAERAAIRAAFEAAANGVGRIVAVSGEPGIGKSTLVEDFLAEIATPAWVARGRCSERLAGAEAHLPFLEALDSLLTREPSAAEVMKRVAPSWYVHVAPMSGESSSAARLLPETANGSAERLMREMAALLHELSRSRPFVLFLDDVHWADVSTIDLIGFLAPKLSTLRGLMLLTYRPSDLTVSRHPFLRLKTDLAAHGVLHDAPMPFLSEQDVTQYVSAQLPAAPASAAALIYRKTEGNPLFMADLVRDLRERDVVDGWAAEIGDKLPESLRGMIERKLERLNDQDRQLLRVAAVQGVQFDSAIVAAVLDRDPADVEDALQALDRVHGVVQLVREQELPNRVFSLRYQFVHVLYQSALYGSIAPTRKAGWSSRVAGVLEAAFGDRKRTIAAELAVLYEVGRDPSRAAEHFLTASHVAASRFATQEALAFSRRGLAVLATLPVSADVEARELALQKAVLVPLHLLDGFGTPATERVSQRIVELSERLRDHGSLFAALDGQLVVHLARGQCLEAGGIVDRMIDVARQSGSDVQAMNAHMWGTTLRHHRGHLRDAHAHAEACLRLEAASNAATRITTIFDPVVATLAESSRNLWLLGESTQSLAWAERAVTVAREVRHPNSLAFALLFHAWAYGYRGDWDTCVRSVEEGVALSTRLGLIQTTAWLRCAQGWTSIHTGKTADGLAELQGGIADSVRILGHIAMPSLCAMLADVLIARGEHARALDEVQRSLEANRTTHDNYFDAELLRLEGQCLLALDEREAAEAALDRAIAVARAQGALTFELRATTALGQLWASRGEAARARDTLSNVLERLPDPEPTADVRRAQGLQTEWSR
jgi:tetratricopeptide (TPR) repeat protein